MAIFQVVAGTYEDGTHQTRSIAQSVQVPVIASGGAIDCEHIYQALTTGHAQAALLASLLHYGELTVAEITAYLDAKKVTVRI